MPVAFTGLLDMESAIVGVLLSSSSDLIQSGFRIHSEVAGRTHACHNPNCATIKAPRWLRQTGAGFVIPAHCITRDTKRLSRRPQTRRPVYSDKQCCNCDIPKPCVFFASVAGVKLCMTSVSHIIEDMGPIVRDSFTHRRSKRKYLKSAPLRTNLTSRTS